MHRNEHSLSEQTFLKGLESRHLTQMVECAVEVRFGAGDFAFREGDEARCFYIIQHGRIALEIYGPGRGRIPITTLHDGDALGWSWLFPPYRWHFDARALEPTTALAFDAPSLRALLETDHDLGYDLMKRFAQTIAQRLQATRLQLLDVYGPHTRAGDHGQRGEGRRYDD